MTFRGIVACRFHLLRLLLRLLVQCKRAYRCSAPAFWNSLPKTVVNGDSVTVLKSRLKVFLFSQAFSLPSSAWPHHL